MNWRLAEALRIKPQPRLYAHNLRTVEVIKRYAEREWKAICALPDWPGRLTSPGWLKRGDNRERVNWHRARKYNCIPKWVDRAALLAVYLRAAMLNLQVDHYYPMRGKRVCGLHVADNLRIVTGLENMRKGSDSPDAGSNY